MEKHKIKSYIKQIRGVSYKPDDLCDVLDNSSVILLRANNIEDGIINFDSIQYVRKSKVSSEQYLKKGDILICASSGSKSLVGKAASFDFDIECTFGAFCKVIRPKDGYSQYLSVFFQSQSYRQKISEFAIGANINNIRNEHIDELYISMYPESERCFIVKKVNTVQSIIYWRKYMIKKLDELIKARFIELFGDININNKNWNCESLRNLCTIVRGGSPRPIEQFLGGDVPWIKISDATDGDNIYLNSTKEYIIKEGVKRSRLVKSGSLIFANCGVSLGFARIITFDGCIHDGWLAMEDIDVRLDKVFLLQSLNQMTEYFRKIAPAGTQPNLNTAIMKEYKQVVPPIELQRDFIRFVEQVNKSKVEVQKALDKAQLLFDSLMQKYFG